MKNDRLAQTDVLRGTEPKTCWYKHLHGYMSCDDGRSTVDSTGVEE